MRKKIVAGNWKMNMNFDEGNELIDSIIEKLTNRTFSLNFDELGVVLAPPFILLKNASELCYDNKRI